jgi:DNA-directed RNA polymerase specialized sigma24 family protein
MTSQPSLFALLEGAFDRDEPASMAKLQEHIRQWLRPKIPSTELEDRVQDALIQIVGFWRKEGREQLRAFSDERTRGYLHRLVSNAAISAWRKEKRTTQVRATSPDAALERPGGIGEDEFTIEQLNDALQKALASLDQAVVARHPALRAVFAQIRQLASDPTICNDDLIQDEAVDRRALRATLQQHHCRWRKTMLALADERLASGDIDESLHWLISKFIEHSRQRRRSR